jgi:hypothetical protein
MVVRVVVDWVGNEEGQRPGGMVVRVVVDWVGNEEGQRDPDVRQSGCSRLL